MRARARVCVCPLFYVSTKEGEKVSRVRHRKSIFNSILAGSATVKLSRNCVRVFYDLLRDIGSWPRYIRALRGELCKRLPMCDVPLSFRALYIREYNICKNIFIIFMSRIFSSFFFFFRIKRKMMAKYEILGSS